MSKIVSWGHLTSPMQSEQLKKFGEEMAKRINEMQENNLEVEVQYQQSDLTCSVLILGKEK
jgi:DNA-binding protein YbaB